MKYFFNTTISPLYAWSVWGIRVVRNAMIDIRYGRLLGGRIESRYAHLGSIQTENTDYKALSVLHLCG